MSENLISLDGPWDIIFDPQNEGRGLKWYTPENFASHSAIESITVPACWETVRQDYEGVAWYRKQFDMPDGSDLSGSVRISFDAVNYIADVWLNGSPLGHHEGGFTGFELEMADLVKPKGNTLILRVLGPIVMQDIRIDGLGRNDAPHWRGAITGGIWQSVRILSSDKSYIRDVFIKPDIEAMEIEVDLDISHSGNEIMDATLQLSVPGIGEHTLTTQLLPGSNPLTVKLPMTGATLWSLEHPQLYALETTLATREHKDETKHRFGMRTFSVANKRFTLNNEPLYLKAAFYEGLYPHTLATPTREMVEKELRLAMEAGFNMIRPWRKPPPPFVYEIADELGLLFVGGLPIECMGHWPAIGPELKRRIEIEIRESILRDRNHACIVQWELFNEILRPELGRLKQPMALLARELDPTRMIIDESGGYAGGANIYFPGSRVAVSYNEFHVYTSGPMDESWYQTLNALGSDKTADLDHHNDLIENAPLNYISEIGFGSNPDLEANCEEYQRNGNPLTPDYRYHHELRDGFQRALKETQFDEFFPDLSAFCVAEQEIHAEANKLMLEAARLNPEVGGYCLHALTDGDWILGAGLLDLFRNPKLPYYSTREANQKQYLAIHPAKRTVWVDDAVEIDLSFINESSPTSGTVNCVILDEKEKECARYQTSSKGSSGISELLVETFKPKTPGKYHIKADFKNPDDELIASNHISLLALAPTEVKQPVMLAGLGAEVEAFLDTQGIPWSRPSELNPNTPLLLGDLATDVHKTIQAEHIKTFVNEGGTAICLELPEGEPFRDGQKTLHRIEADWLPQALTTRHTSGMWTGSPALIRKHAVSNGLPANCMMGAHYESVTPQRTLLECQGELLVGTITYGWFRGEELRGYLGPEEVYWGANLISVPFGKGRYVLSTLRLTGDLQNLPMAQAILLNLIHYAGEKS